MKLLVALAAFAGLTLTADPGADPAHGAGIAQDSLGKTIFTGKGLCAACHGPAAKGTALAPDLTDGTWLHTDGTLESVAKVIKDGVTQPKEHPAPMPPMGGAQLTDAEIQAVARYVVSLGQAP